MYKETKILMLRNCLFLRNYLFKFELLIRYTDNDISFGFKAISQFGFKGCHEFANETKLFLNFLVWSTTDPDSEKQNFVSTSHHVFVET